MALANGKRGHESWPLGYFQAQSVDRNRYNRHQLISIADRLISVFDNDRTHRNKLSIVIDSNRLMNRYQFQLILPRLYRAAIRLTTSFSIDFYRVPIPIDFNLNCYRLLIYRLPTPGLSLSFVWHLRKRDA